MRNCKHGLWGDSILNTNCEVKKHTNLIRKWTDDIKTKDKDNTKSIVFIKWKTKPGNRQMHVLRLTKRQTSQFCFFCLFVCLFVCFCLFVCLFFNKTMQSFQALFGRAVTRSCTSERLRSAVRSMVRREVPW